LDDQERIGQQSRRRRALRPGADQQLAVSLVDPLCGRQFEQECAREAAVEAKGLLAAFVVVEQEKQQLLGQQ